MIEFDNENKNNNLINMQNMQNMSGKINNKMMMNYKQNIPFQQNYTNRYYNNINNINNNLINQNSINIININFDYINQKNNLSTTRTYINSNNININMKVISTKVKCTCSKTGCKKKYCACFSKGKYCEDCECKECENRPQNINISYNAKNKEKMEKINHQKTEISNHKNQRVICNCTKSNCMKKYCECYKQGFNCNSLCRCIECKNKNYIATNDTNNFYNYALNGSNIINLNNNLSQVHDFSTSYIPETFCKSIDYNNPINFQSEAFAIYIKRDKLIIERRKINLIINNHNLNNNHNNNDENNNKEKAILQNNFNDFNETPKFSNKKRLRGKNDSSAGIKTCPTTNSSNRRKKGFSVVNKNIKKKRLQLN